MMSLIKKISRGLGIEIKRFTPERSEAARMQRLLSYHNINLILDVGANIGQYVKFVRDAGYAGRIISFEPLSSAYATLVKTSQRDALWEVAPRTAIGHIDGEIELHVANNSQSSSALNMLSAHEHAAPYATYVGSEKVPLSKLDTIAKPYINPSDSVYLKIDVQGFESQVLEGASQLLPQIKGIQIELSLISLYEGQLLFNQMLEKMQQLGYCLHALIPDFTDAKTGRLLQVDGVFFKEEQVVSSPQNRE